jgi:hypothetical protein
VNFDYSLCKIERHGERYLELEPSFTRLVYSSLSLFSVIRPNLIVAKSSLDTNPTLRIRLRLTNDGRCEGPQPLRMSNYSYEACTKAINLHTCKLQIMHRSDVGKFEDILSFQHRCHECQRANRMYRLLRSLGLYDELCSSKARECRFERCDRTVTSKHSPVCFNHLTYHYFQNRYSVAKMRSAQDSSVGVRELIQTRHSDLSSQLKMVASIMQPDPAKNDDIPMPPIERHKYVFVDTEFSTFTTSANTVILQEVAVLDIHGRIVLQRYIDWQRSESKLAAQRHQSDSYAIDEEYDNSHSSEQSTGSPITVQQLWNEMSGLGIRSDTVIIEWSTSGSDINVLRKVAHYFGLQNVLCPQNYISPLLAWRRFVPEFPSMAMDILFPAVFPDSPLVGRNHNAVPDVLMLWKLTALLCASAKPVESRDLSRFFSTREDLALLSQHLDQGPAEPGDDFPILEASVHPFRSRLYGYAHSQHKSKSTKKASHGPRS